MNIEDQCQAVADHMKKTGSKRVYLYPARDQRKTPAKYRRYLLAALLDKSPNGCPGETNMSYLTWLETLAQEKGYQLITTNEHGEVPAW